MEGRAENVNKYSRNEAIFAEITTLMISARPDLTATLSSLESSITRLKRFTKRRRRNRSNVFDVFIEVLDASCGSPRVGSRECQ